MVTVLDWSHRQKFGHQASLYTLMVIGPPFQAMDPFFFMKSDLVSGLLSLRPPLVGGDWNMFYFSIQLGMSSSQLTNSYFSEGLGEKPPTSPLSMLQGQFNGEHAVNTRSHVHLNVALLGRRAHGSWSLDPLRPATASEHGPCCEGRGWWRGLGGKIASASVINGKDGINMSQDIPSG